MVDDRVELGVELLSKLEHDTLSLAEVVDRIETITDDPTLTRRVLEEADRRGAIEREEGVVTPRRGDFVRFESEVEVKEGDFTCRRCGASLSTGYFLQLSAGEFGPFGSTCIKRITGRK